jgi:ABC-2 type transport system ATP-binding protein
VLLATHSLDIVEHYADRAAILIDGRLKREWQREEIRQIRESGKDFEAELTESLQT